MSGTNKTEELLEKIADAFNTIVPGADILSYPKEAVKPGTIIRANRLDSLGVVIDAFYGELDKDNQKVIIYNVLLFPQKNPITQKTEDQYYLSNEYEYEITAYLMLKPVDLKKFKQILGGSLF